jgi:hypothetical protein
MSKPRQAVVLIHGIGEQRPMDTLRNFVLGVLGGEVRPDGSRAFYSKPDLNAEGFELRRLRAFEGKADSDFIEFYWQHLMPVAAWQYLFSWLWLLMRRPVGSMPGRFAFLWWICWAALILIVGAGVASSVSSLGGHHLPVPSLPKLSGIAALAATSAGYLIRSFVGDAAIYLNPHPRTVEARNRIRAAGVSLLERLHADGRYDRIIVVGHSLGSVIGYDIVSFSWNRASDVLRRDIEAGVLPTATADQQKLSAAEALAGMQPSAIRAGWTQATRDLHYEQKRLGQHWLITDFITVGSPLAHASLLLAHGPADLERRKLERELPASPPVREDGQHFSYVRETPRKDRQRLSARVIDHAGVFATTVWTNLYFPCRFLLFGDLVGGAVAPAFGAGVHDIPVKTKVRFGWLAHTEYWTRYGHMTADAAPERLIAALDLGRVGLAKPIAAAGPGGALEHGDGPAAEI